MPLKGWVEGERKHAMDNVKGSLSVCRKEAQTGTPDQGDRCPILTVEELGGMLYRKNKQTNKPGSSVVAKKAFKKAFKISSYS